MTHPDDSCFHCGLPLPQPGAYPVEIEGKARPMCCPGCQAVATAIVDGGLTRFYQYRDRPNHKADEGEGQQVFDVYDLPDIQRDFVIALAEDAHQANLLLDGISCAACSWLIEQHMGGLDGVQSVRVNVTSHRTQVIYNPNRIPLSRVMAQLAAIGYRPVPATDEQQQRLETRQNRRALLRLGVAGFGMMQAGMVAVGLYTGAADQWQSLLRWLSLLFCTPVVFFSAWPFFRAAVLSLRRGQLIMDVPVALAVGLGYGASVWATLTGSGEVYFESVAMFVFFLLLGRYLEMRSRARSRVGRANVAQLLPVVAKRFEHGRWQQVPARLVAVGDRIAVDAGQSFCADGRILRGETAVNEALLTGESRPVGKSVGDAVIAGSENIDSPVEIEVIAVGADTQLSAVERLIDRAEGEKPRRLALADRVARYFVGAVLCVCALVFALWWHIDASRAFWVALSVLIVTCPCALALAMPTALTAATERLRALGVLVTRGHVLETLPHVDRVIFDKTGTLTSGQLSVAQVHPLRSGTDRDWVLALAAALEQGTGHPIASAFTGENTALAVESRRQITGAGVEASHAGKRYRLGRADYAAQTPLDPPDGSRLWLLLADDGGAIAWIGLDDPIRPEAREVLAELRAAGLPVELLSGDGPGNVARVAGELGMERFRHSASADDKLAYVAQCQAGGETVMMVGDGINDVPVLSRADVSVAMARASELAHTHADAILLADSLTPLGRALTVARRTRAVIRQNLALSVVYNLCALPLAAAGWVPPWAAALGMTTSSLVVVLNAMRLSR